MLKLLAIIIVNLLTLVRVIGTFCLLPIYKNYGGLAATGVAITCYFTDFLDGILARKCKASTFFGSAFDGVADKLFTVANLAILIHITKFAIIPILCEIAIIIIQTIKYHKNFNVQSSTMGKLKTWIIFFTVILLYLVTEIEQITFLPDRFINFVTGLDQFILLGTLFIPLYIFEMLTLVSYLKFLENTNEKIEVPKIDINLKEVKTLKDGIDNFCTLWLNNDFYEKYKDSAGLKEIKRQIKHNKRT